MKNFTLATICGVALAVSASGATAATVSLERIESGSSYGTPAWNGRVDRTLNGDLREGIRSGLFRLTDGVKDILAFCIQPAVSLDLDLDFDTMIPAATAEQLVSIDKLYTSAYAEVDDSQSALAFQLALWEIMAEDPLTAFDLSTGNMHVTNETVAGAIDLGSDFLGRIASASTGGYTLTTYVNSGQNLISAEIASPVPLPAPALLLFGGLGGLAGLRRWKKTS